MENSAGFEDGNGFINDNENNLPDDREVPMPSVSNPDNGGNNIPENQNQEEDSRFSENFLGVKDLMKISWKMLGERIAKFAVLTILVFALFFVALIIFVAIVAFLKSWIAALSLGIPAFIFILILFLADNIALLEIVGDKDIRVRDAIKKSFSKIFSYFKASLAYAAVSFTAILPIVLIGVLYAILITIFTVGSNNNSDVTRSVMNITNWALGILVIIFTLALIPISILLNAWHNFLFLSLVVDGKAIVESMAYSYGIIKHRKKAVILKMLAFTIFYLIILVPFATISKNNLTLGILYQIVSFIFGLWMLMFGYAMFKNLKAISSAEINPQDVKNVKKFIKIGALGLVIGIIILVVGMAFAAVAIYKQFPNGLTGQNKSASFMQEQLKDSDGDGFRDVQEKVLGTDPYKKDTDGDGLSDYDEMYKWHTDPLKADTDMDGYKDGEEIASGYDPLGPGKLNAGSWIYDVCQGIGIYSVDISQSLQWEKTKTVCVSPQCNGGVLAADNNVDFSNYPARDACKTVGGRLPTKSEFICLYANYIPKQDREYWSSELYNDDGTSAQFFSYDNNFPDNYVGGGADVDAYMYIRCVKDNQNS